MTNIIRTCITLPEPLWQQARLYAAAKKTTLSYLIKEGLQHRIKGNYKGSKKHSFLELAGSLDLKGKEPPTRAESYEEHLKHKMGG